MNLVQALYLNNAAEPFNNEKVRQALCYAVDKQQIIDVAFDGYGSPIGSSMYPAFQKYFVEDLTDYYPYDPERARELLAEAGYPDGFSMTITVPSNYQPHIDTATVLVEQLKAVGITAEIQPVEWGAWLSEVYGNRQFQSTVVGVDASNMTARALLERFTSAADDNFINYQNTDYDALFQQAQAHGRRRRADRALQADGAEPDGTRRQCLHPGPGGPGGSAERAGGIPVLSHLCDGPVHGPLRPVNPMRGRYAAAAPGREMMP